MGLEDEIIAAETRRCSAILRADAAELLECLDDEMVYVHSNAVVEDRETYIAKLVSGERKYLGFKTGARTFRQLGEAVACIGEIEVESLNGPVPLVATVVYKRRGGGSWKMVLWHSCSAKRP